MRIDCVLNPPGTMMASRLKPQWYIAGLVCGLALSLPCQAQNIEQDSAAAEPGPPQATTDQLIDEGVKYYHDGEYQLAIARFADAYATNGDPNLLFNIGRCHEALEQSSEAIENYEAYLASEGIDSLGAQRARAALKELTSPQKLPPTTEHSQKVSEPSENQPRAPTVSDSPSEQADLPQKSSAWPLVTLASGLGGILGGAAVFAWGQHDHRAVTNATGYGESDERFALTQAEAQQFVDDGDRKKGIGVASMSIGAALVATSVTWLVLRRHGGNAGVTMSVSAWAGGGAASVRGEF